MTSPWLTPAGNIAPPPEQVERRHVNDPVIWGAVEQIRSTEMFWKQRQIERLHCKIALLEQQLAEGKAFDPAMTEDYLWQFARELPQHVAVAADPASPATTGVALVDPLFSDDSAAAGATAAASASHDLADRVAAPVPLLSSDAGGAVNNIVPRPSPAHVAASPLGASLGSSDQSDDAGALLLLQPAMATATVPPPPRSLANAVAGAAGLFLGAATIWCATAAALNAAAQQF